MPSTPAAQDLVKPRGVDAGAPPHAGLRALWSWRWRLIAGVVILGLVGYFAVPFVLGPVLVAVPVVRGALVQSVVATGRVETPHRVNSASQITGMVAEIPVAEGQTVRAGQVLLVLEDSELRATVSQAESAVSIAETRLKQMLDVTLPVAKENLSQAEANLLNAEQQFSRTSTLSSAGFETLAQRDAVRKTLDVARAVARAMQVQVTSSSPGGIDYIIAETNLVQAKAALQIARARHTYTRVVAPAAGTLIGRNVEPGWVVPPNQTLMVLSPDGETQIVVQVDEKNLGLVALGQQALASADAFADRNFPVELIYINPAVDPQRASVEAKLRVPAPPDYLRQDMTVSVDIAVAERANILVLPVAAVHDAAGARPFVLRITDGRARRQAVRIGLRGVRQVEILEGLNEGDRIVPVAAAIADGGKVRDAGSAAR